MPSRAATNADRIVEMLKAAGVQRLFGMPGGGSIADLIEAAGDAGLPFSLAHTETAAAFMASAQAEITGTPGACLATLGPGAASLMNGIANASLDRIPLLAITDCLGAAECGVMRHQALPHGEMFVPLVKWTGRPRPCELEDALERALAELHSLPPGPVHLDISSEVTATPAASPAACPSAWPAASPSAWPAASPSASPARGADTHVCRVETHLDAFGLSSTIASKARYPVFLVGLGARTAPIARALRDACERLHIPALVTYKAKGVIPDGHPWFGGVFTHASLECNVLDRADLFIAVGLDPVELLPRPWKHPQPVIALNPWPMETSQMPVATEHVGDLVALIEGLAASLTESDWERSKLQALVEDQRQRMRPPAQEDSSLLPHRVVEIVAQTYTGARITVDAGCHMFPVMAHWPADEPNGVLISNGLSTMGFALPAAIGAALLDRSKPVIVFTGDGGLMMCAAELATAARENLPLRIIVFQDDSLSLIKVKQEQRGYRTDGVSFAPIAWDDIARGFGLAARVASDEDELKSHLLEFADVSAHPRPVLIAARISYRSYAYTIQALRG